MIFRLPLLLEGCRTWYTVQFTLVQGLLSSVELVLILRGQLLPLSHDESVR